MNGLPNILAIHVTHSVYAGTLLCDIGSL